MKKISNLSLAKITNAELVNFLSQAIEASNKLTETIDQNIISAVKNSKTNLELEIESTSTVGLTQKLMVKMREMLFGWQVIKYICRFNAGTDGVSEISAIVGKYGVIRDMNMFEKRTNLRLMADELKTKEADMVESLGIMPQVELIIKDSDEFEVLYNERAALRQSRLGALTAARDTAEQAWYSFVTYINAYQLIQKVDFDEFSSEIIDLYAKLKGLSVNTKKTVDNASAAVGEESGAEVSSEEPAQSDANSSVQDC